MYLVYIIQIYTYNMVSHRHCAADLLFSVDMELFVRFARSTLTVVYVTNIVMKNYLGNNSMRTYGRKGRDTGDHGTAAKYIARREKWQTLKYVQERHFFIMIYTRMNFLKYHLEYMWRKPKCYQDVNSSKDNSFLIAFNHQHGPPTQVQTRHNNFFTGQSSFMNHFDCPPCKRQIIPYKC